MAKTNAELEELIVKGVDTMSYLDEKGVNKLWTKCKAKFAPISHSHESLLDYGDTTNTIKIGYRGNGLTASQIAYIAGYSVDDPQKPNEHKIKDISKDVLKSWLGYAEVATGTFSKNTTLNISTSTYLWIVLPTSNTVSPSIASLFLPIIIFPSGVIPKL